MDESVLNWIMFWNCKPAPSTAKDTAVEKTFTEEEMKLRENRMREPLSGIELIYDFTEQEKEEHKKLKDSIVRGEMELDLKILK